MNSEDADGLFDENEKAFLIEQYREMKAPLYYEDYDGWKSALSYAQTIIMLIMLVSAFLVSGIFPMNLVGNRIPYFSQQNTERIGEREQRSWQDLSWYQLFTLL